MLLGTKNLYVVITGREIVYNDGNRITAYIVPIRFLLHERSKLQMQRDKDYENTTVVRIGKFSVSKTKKGSCGNTLFCLLLYKMGWVYTSIFIQEHIHVIVYWCCIVRAWGSFPNPIYKTFLCRIPQGLKATRFLLTVRPLQASRHNVLLLGACIKSNYTNNLAA